METTDRRSFPAALRNLLEAYAQGCDNVLVDGADVYTARKVEDLDDVIRERHIRSNMPRIIEGMFYRDAHQRQFYFDATDNDDGRQESEANTHAFHLVTAQNTPQSDLNYLDDQDRREYESEIRATFSKQRMYFHRVL